MILKKNQQKTARMAVRRYVLDLMYQHEGESVLVPSYNVLKEQLGIAKSTAQAELNALRDEGLIITKVGVGSFTNPVSCFAYGKKKKHLISVIRGNGKLIFDAYYSLSMYGNIIQELAKLPAVIQDVNLYSTSEEDLFEELRGIQSDAIIWLSPPSENKDVLKKLNQVRPVITVDFPIEGIPGVAPDLIDMGYRMGCEMVRRNLISPLIYQGKRYAGDELTGFKLAYSEAGVPLESITYIDQDSETGLQSYFESGKRPDSILFAYDRELELLELLREFKVDLKSECTLVSSMYKPMALEGPLLLIPYRFDWLAKAVANTFLRCMENPQNYSEHKIIKIIETINNKAGEIV